MLYVQVQSSPWDKVYAAACELDVKTFDQVVFKSDAGVDLGRIVDVSDKAYTEEEMAEVAEILRLATQDDLTKKLSLEIDKAEAMRVCAELIRSNGLTMKLVDMRKSLDGARLTFAFVADGRIDFRQLVKDLSRHFSRNIRLQQIGARDETRLKGDCGKCGKCLCCTRHLVKLPTVNSEMVEAQSSGARNPDRLSGSCGRLMCCLSYEVEGYRYLAGKMPPIGARVNVDGQKGTIVGHHLLKESVDVRFPGEKGEPDYVVEVDLNRNNDKEK